MLGSTAWAQATGATGAASNAASNAAAQLPADGGGLAKLDANFWEARSDRYSVECGSVSLGDGTISLKPVSGDCFEYLSEPRPIALVRWTYGSPVDFSRFCVRDNQEMGRASCRARRLRDVDIPV